jgi:Fe(3+) dicitrate transport protein
MMRFKVFSLLFLALQAGFSFAQYSISGRVLSSTDSSGVKECTVYLNNGKEVEITDHKGRFSFTDLPNGEYVVQALSRDLEKNCKQTVSISHQNAEISLYLDAHSKEMDEVLISEKKTDFGFTHLNAVDNMGIYEGKKSEVILVDKLVANTSTNNARQIYSRVAGLNIWEYDAAGLQLGIGGRGLDPNRTSNFNVRQNGYDISADALGYPESYYSPPAEGLESIQIVRGAASLQYGTQFGGYINFVMKKPVTNKKIEVTARQTLGSYGFYNAFTSLGGTVGKLGYYGFYQYKKGDGWRPNSQFESHTAYAHLEYNFTGRTKLSFDFTHLSYLAQQPGGLTDVMFLANPRQSNRERNWFKVNWNLAALHFNHKFNARNEINVRFFGLLAYRYSIGFRPKEVDKPDSFNERRDLVKGEFENWGAEARYLKHYKVFKMPTVALLGLRYYHGYNQNLQGIGAGSRGRDVDFSVQYSERVGYEYQHPNRNVSVFLENIFYLRENLTLTPGFRFEYINTKANGYYRKIVDDLAGNVVESAKKEEQREDARQFGILGIGLSYKPISKINLYTNVSQNYRSITFNDMRQTSYSLIIDPNLKDESGFSYDLGIRSENIKNLSFDISAFYLNYANRIGEVIGYDEQDKEIRNRGNIGQAIIMGVESYVELDLLKCIFTKQDKWSGVAFANNAFIQSEYVKSDNKLIQGKQVEFVPAVNSKTGLRMGYREFKIGFQYTYLSDQYSDASNTRLGNRTAVVGIIPAYAIMDLSASYEWKWFKLEGSVNNLSDAVYFTRRATGYPGPGILPSDGRTFYLTLQVKI